ncbi:ABC transporter permease [Maribellus comscasis]|uniref:ABC transporter permease n=1 Tax=Maribellus comscasis TaxID=2681766 RepID=UPI00131E88AA|nr:ABC transporter permease [Maribellus comscasis]
MTILNLIGLTVGITVSMLVFLFVLKEKNTDKFIPDVNNIYVLTDNNEPYFSQNMVNHIKTEIPEIENITYCANDWSPQVFLAKNQESFKVEKMLTADSCFFKVFQFETVLGDSKNGLNAANKIVLTRSLAEKIFGKENPIGNTVTYNASYLSGIELEVTAVIEDLPQSSSWDFGAVLSFQTNYQIDWYVNNMKDWGSRNYKAFARLNKNISEQNAEGKLSDINLTALPENYQKSIKYGLFPFKRAYFDFHELGILKKGNRFTLSVIGIVGLLILLLSCVNYVNMITAQREKRYKNVGIYKTMGSSSRKIIEMATTESLLMLLITIAVSFALILLLLPAFNTITGSRFNFHEIFSQNFLLLYLFIAGVMVLLTGVIPGVIFGNKPVTLLMKKNVSVSGDNWARNSLLVFQFVVSIALITSILVINRQNNYMQNRDAGFAKENIVYANTNKAIYSQINAFKNEIKQIAGVNDITFSESVLIANDQNWGMNLSNNGEKYDIQFSKLSVASNFFDFFGIKLNEGNGFNDNSKNNKDFIINQTAKADFRIDNINDARVAYPELHEGNIIGVVDDYNFESFHVPVRAAAFRYSGDCDDVLYIKINTQNIAAFNTTMKEVKQLWDRISPDFPLEYQFLDQKYTAMYTKEAQFQRFLMYTTIVSLILSCLGLVGLTFFVMEQRTKEIGIRKVNGAKISEVLAMLNKDFVKWVTIAFVIATPLAYYAMNKWLGSFAYKTSLSWWIFALSGLLALGIALLTVSWQSWRAATRSPVEALRYE